MEFGFSAAAVRRSGQGRHGAQNLKAVSRSDAFPFCRKFQNIGRLAHGQRVWVMQEQRNGC